MGHRPHVRRNLGRSGLRVLHHRRVLADDRRLARRRSHAHADGPRRDRDGPLEPGLHHAGLRCHSDAGSQFTSIRYGERLAEIGAVPSIGSVGDSYDNALAETVNGYYKAELIRGPTRNGPWKTVEEVELATLGWVHWHNTQRLHGYLGDLPPAEFEELHAARQALNPGVLSVAPPARKPAERLPQPPPDAIEGEIASEPPLQPSPVTAPALTASAALPEDATPDRAMARWNNNINTNHLTAQPEEDYATRQADTVLA